MLMQIKSQRPLYLEETMFEYQLERLNQNIVVCVTPEHKFGTDAFLLANFASPRRKDLVCDLGTGCGIIPFIWCKRHKPKEIWGVEIQPQGIEQFQIGLDHSTVEPVIHPVCGDLKKLSGMPFGQFDLVTCNPPYFSNGAGFLSEMSAEQVARHETRCTIQDVCQSAAKLLKYGGKLCVCQRPERLADTICSMREAGLEPKRLRMVAKYPDSTPWLFLLEGKKGSKPFLQVMPTLGIYEGEEFSQEMQKIYDWEAE